MQIKKSILLFIFFIVSDQLIGGQLICDQSIIVLYGCSSAGKTSIAQELLQILPGNWKYVAANQFSSFNRNVFLWRQINQNILDGYDVIVDTHDLNFLYDPRPDLHVVVTLLYCSPHKLIEHVSKRNLNANAKTHRALKAVFSEYCKKYKAVKKNEPHIDKLYKDSLKNRYGFFVSRALKQLIFQYFSQTDRQVVYIAPFLTKYSCFVDTGKTSIEQGAATIKQALMSQWKQKD